MRKKEPKFALSLPIGHWHPLLPASLASLASQAAHLEIALMDASGDDRVCEALAASGLDFHYFHAGPDGGQAAAIARGWKETNADILGWLNVDDQLAEGALRRVANIFDSDETIGVVFGDSEFVDGTGKVTGKHDQVSEISDLIYRSNTISQPSCFIRREHLDAIGGINPSLIYTMDWDLWMRLYAHGARFHYVPEILSRVYMGNGTKTSELSVTRLLEIAVLVGRRAGAWSAVKSVVSTAVQPWRNNS